MRTKTAAVAVVASAAVPLKLKAGTWLAAIFVSWRTEELTSTMRLRNGATSDGHGVVFCNLAADLRPAGARRRRRKQVEPTLLTGPVQCKPSIIPQYHT